MVALLGGVPSGKGRLPDGIVKRAGTPGPRWPSPRFLGSAAALRARRPQKRPAAPRLPYRGRAPRLPSRCSFSAGAPRAAAARQLPPRGTRDRQLGSWFGLGLVTGTAHGTGEGSRWGRGGGGGAVNACAAQPRADTCPVAGAAKSGLGDIFSWRNVVSSPIRRNAPQSTGAGRRGGAGDVPPGDRHQPVLRPALPLWGASRRRAPPKQTRTPAWTQMSS